MRKILLSSTVVILFLVSQLCVALSSPVNQFQNIANQMISSLDKNRSSLSNISVIRRIVNKILLPNVDLNRMSASVVGRYWVSATSAQKEQFKREFAYLVTTTYAAALSSYNNDKVQFYPLRENITNQQTMQIRSVIIRQNGQRIPISYDVVRAGNQWKVYDFSIENVSMVQSYRSQFSNVLASGGMSTLLTRLKQHNMRTA